MSGAGRSAGHSPLPRPAQPLQAHCACQPVTITDVPVFDVLNALRGRCRTRGGAGLNSNPALSALPITLPTLPRPSQAPFSNRSVTHHPGLHISSLSLTPRDDSCLQHSPLIHVMAEDAHHPPRSPRRGSHHEHP